MTELKTDLKVRPSEGGRISVPRTTGASVAAAARAKPDKVSINFQVPRQLRDDFSKFADKHGVNMSKFLRKQVERFVEAAKAGSKKPAKDADFQYDLDTPPDIRDEEPIRWETPDEQLRKTDIQQGEGKDDRPPTESYSNVPLKDFILDRIVR